MSKFAVVTFNDIPNNPMTYKYEVLGEMSLLSHRLYCERCGYDFINHVEIDRSRPVCWSKMPAIFNALQEHEWVLWVDSDTLVSNMSLRLEDLCDPHYDLIVQYQEFWWELIGLENGTERFPINSGAFLIKSSSWSKQFLQDAYSQIQYVTYGEIWDGIGDQEAMNHCIRTNADYQKRIKYVQKLQISPRLFQKGYLLVHFYGNYAQHYIPVEQCVVVFERWLEAIKGGKPLPDDMMRFHWCCIQNKNSHDDNVRVDLDHYMYTSEEVSA